MELEGRGTLSRGFETPRKLAKGQCRARVTLEIELRYGQLKYLCGVSYSIYGVLGWFRLSESFVF